MNFFRSILNPLSDIVAKILAGIHSVLGGVFGADSGWAWGLSIVVLVMFLKALLVPLFVKQVRASRKMAEHAPQLQAIRKKFKNDKQRLQEETMKYYKENGVNPLAGCLPMVPQMIIFFSLFDVIEAIARWKPGQALPYGLSHVVVESAQKATIFGVHIGDKLMLPHTPGLGTSGSVVIAITVVISAATTFLSTRQSAKRGLMQGAVTDPSNPMAGAQKYMMYVVPFFSLTGLYWQYGLVLYWVTSNGWTLGQQYIMFRNWEPVTPGDAPGSGGAKGTGTSKPPAGGSPRGGSGTSRMSRAAGAGKRAGTGTGGVSGKSGVSVKGSAAGTSGAAKSNAAKNGASVKGGASVKEGGSTRAGSAGKSTAARKTAGSEKTAGSGKDAASRRPAGKAGSGSGAARNGSRGRFGRSKAAEPEQQEPEVRVVRNQPSRSSRSKRTGSR